MANNLINELKKTRQSNDISKHITYKLVENCLNTIKLINKNGVTSYIYEIPPFLVGFPCYDMILSTDLVNTSLKKKGFKTIYIKPNKIFIKW